MFSKFKELLFIPPWDAKQESRQVELIKKISLGVIGITLLGCIFEAVFLPASLPYLIACAITCIIFFVSYLLLCQGWIHAAGLFLVVSIWIVATWINFFVEASGVFGFSGYILVLLISSLLFNERVGLFFFLLIILVNMGALLIEILGIASFKTSSIISPEMNVRAGYWIAQGILFLLFAMLLRLAFRTLQEALSRAQQNEQHLARRAMQIQAAAEVSRDATAVREMDQVLNRAVDLICERFGFYYAAIYLVDDHGEFVVLRAATGEAGRALLEREHKLRIGKEGMIGYVANTGQPRVTLDVGKDAVHFKNPLLPHTRSEMSLPLMVKQRVLGVLDVQSEVEAAFSEEDIEVLQTMADQLAVAYETARLFEAAQRQLRELTVLHAVAIAATQIASEDTLIELVTQIIGDAFYPDNFGVILLDERKGMLQKHPSYRERVEDGNIPYPLGSGVTGMVAKEGKSWRVSDINQEPVYVVVDPEALSELCVPIKIGERVVGVLNTESTQLDAFTEADERLLATVAGHLALALENARLFQAEHRMGTDLEALRQASLLLISSLELKPVLQTTLEQALQFVAADYARIYLLEDAQLGFSADLGSDGLAGDSSFILALDESASMVAQSRQRMIINDLLNDPFSEMYKVNGAIICLPLCVGEQLLGVVEIYFSEPHAFDQNDLRILELMADQAALALTNARLYADLERHTQELVQALSRLQEMDRLKNEFIQNVSHELRTPLAVVLGYAELFQSGELGELRPEQHGPMSVIVRRLQGLSMILTDFLIILEIEAYDQPYEPVDLVQLLYKTLAQVEGPIAQAGIHLELRIDPDVPKIRGITDHLRRVIENLLGNALKFTPAGGTIEVRLCKEKDEVVLEVVDTGIGIQEEQLPRVFERFYQVDGTSTRRFGGIGLGLALVKEVVEPHGGRVLVKSQVGKGSTFSVILPVPESYA